MLNLKYKLGELNPQLFREIKGRLKKFNVLLVAFISFVFQLVFFVFALDGELQLIYNWLSVMAIIAILICGTYALINDLATEERRNTLNFIRLSPQSSQSILFGKMLGVPILGNIFILLAIPFHVWLGVNAKLPLNQILFFYVILFAASIFYYSSALLFSLVGSWLGRSQAWLGSGFLTLFFILTQKDLHGDVAEIPAVFRLINPQYFIPDSTSRFMFADLHWFGLPLGKSFTITAGFSLLVYSIGIYFIWQSIERCYHAPNVTMLSKKQSYLLTTSFTAITLGCFNTLDAEALFILIFLNFGLFFYLIAALTPNRQTLQDWARYQHIYSVKHPGKHKLVKDLIWGEKSPALLAIAINALIALTSLSAFIAIASSQGVDKLNALASLIFTFSLVVIYAAIAQLLLFMKNEQRLLYTNTTLAALIILPPMFLSLWSSHPGNITLLWFFSIFAPTMFLFPPANASLGAMVPILAILGQAGILSLLVFQIKRQLQKAGESATKTLLTPN
ncbi:hypothetical protein [Nodularia sphaerocarpa]|uniref:hypothetical protein n=1 Tax=Nodularia sphaerocarpa TaxID=137816 RepID=UPI001EFA9D24|nr:hypothetical protein [Nodularia sphaerocarpa]MDB9373532.1 hypothetical protein [Nodularia sphaerocarpa CS-585]MDB9377668.1 hypothetical protein [Nodularia sphaerocarpa CS-585A2]ULP70629.1 hypothetical protein BDGGKGIB_00245 [Nodularia sphaerocarpa UHCC 0038]